MGKEDKKFVAPAMKPDSELSDFERKQLALLKVGKEHDFNVIIEDVMRFYNSEGWKEKRRDKVKSARDKKSTIEVVWEQRHSSASNKTAVRFTANLPGVPATALVQVLGDDPDRTDAKDTYMYKYDVLLVENPVEHYYGRNVQLNHTTLRAPVFAVAARGMQGYLSYLQAFTHEQQAKLNIVPRKACEGKGDEEKKALRVVAQCLIDFGHFNRTHGIADEAGAQAGPINKKHVLASLFHYLVMSQEELDGSLTLTLMIDVDPAGSLPAKLVDSALSEQLNKMKILVQLCEQAASGEGTCIKPYENTREYFPF